MTDPLVKLIETIEAGEWDFRADAPSRQVFPYNSSSADDLGLTAREAFEGSLDAAKALHEALLPGFWCELRLSTRPRAVVGCIDSLADEQHDNLARAWLLAILKAKLAERDA